MTSEPVKNSFDGDPLKRELMDGDKMFVTEYELDGELYGGQVVADSWEQAERICEIRGNGERVLGVLKDIIPADENGDPLL